MHANARGYITYSGHVYGYNAECVPARLGGPFLYLCSLFRDVGDRWLHDKKEEEEEGTATRMDRPLGATA